MAPEKGLGLIKSDATSNFDESLTEFGKSQLKCHYIQISF